MSKHTPGPWEAAKDPYAEAWVVRTASLDHYTIARVSAAHYGYDSEKAANARLIAAAPDLLAAAERIADYEYRSDRRHRGMVDVSEVESLKRIARAAIARARGEE